jgi:polar amino acid transport system substrate-binding protein
MVRQRWRLLLLAAGLLLAGTVAVVLTRGAQDRSLETIRSLGVLRIGLDPSFPPFESTEANGQVVGYDVDLAQALAAQWGVQVQIEPIGFDGLLDAIWAGRVDLVISALPLDPRFTRDLAYSQPYFDGGLFLVTRASDTTIQQADDLANRQLAVEWGSDADAQGRQRRTRLPGLELVSFQTPAEALDAVMTDRADAALVDGVTARQFVMQNRAARIVEPPLVSAPYVIAMPIKARTLQQAVDEALQDMRQDGTLQLLEERWFAGNP